MNNENLLVDKLKTTTAEFPNFKELEPGQITQRDTAKEASPIEEHFLRSLLAMKELSASAVGRKHLAILYFRYDESSPTKREGNYRVECEIIECGTLSVTFKHYSSYAYDASTKNKYVSQGTGSVRNRTYVSEHRYLTKVKIIWDGSPAENKPDDGLDGYED